MAGPQPVSQAAVAAAAGVSAKQGVLPAGVVAAAPSAGDAHPPGRFPAIAFQSLAPAAVPYGVGLAEALQWAAASLE
jgi:hypothetical protein